MTRLAPYRDFIAELSFEDGRWIIRVLNINDFVSCECAGPKRARKAFKKLIDDYLEFAETIYRERHGPPRCPWSGAICPDRCKKRPFALGGKVPDLCNSLRAEHGMPRK